MATIKTLIGNLKSSTYDVYSTNETVIGTWIDGKPLYRRYFNFTTGSKSGNQYIMNIPNYSDIERITNIYGTYFNLLAFTLTFFLNHLSYT